ncbi:phospholipase D-like domain-containing protein [Nocardia sp. CA-120079]|uniref:phospholipase D-like domain-containing protein n=1 Tax=Nocardia sp. CA-120079 TaxID=3239974 RepID=UPI003D95B9ED
MGNLVSFKEIGGFRVKLWRGESMCLMGFDVDDPEPDFVGFAVEYREPGARKFLNLHNRLSFDSQDAVTGFRTHPTLEAPLQTYRWVHFPFQPRAGTYTYRVTKMHMPDDGQLVAGEQIQLPIDLGPVTIDGFLDVGFARNFASSQAFVEKRAELDLPADIIPAVASRGLEFAERKAAIASKKENIYEWLGFEADRLLFDFLDWAVADHHITVDAMAYDLNEPDILTRLEKLKKRLRVIVDDSGEHGERSSSETKAATRLRASAAEVHRGHFDGLQHNKVLIAKQDGVPVRVLGGSTNLSFRGLYIQANNMYVFTDDAIAALFAEMFERAFTDMDEFAASEFAKVWHSVDQRGRPSVGLCFSPHLDPELALAPVGGAIDQAGSSVLYSFAFMNQTRSGSVRKALDRLMRKPLLSYGVVNESSGMQIKKPSGETGLVDFDFLSEHAPPPFKAEWSGGKGINIHHKFAVIDFDRPTAKVYTGSSNFSPSGEHNNGDHLIVIEDQRVAVAYAVEAIRVFDHLNFRNRMSAAEKARKSRVKRSTDPMLLEKPTAISKKPEPWFAKFYVAGSPRERDRKTFSRRDPTDDDRQTPTSDAESATSLPHHRATRTRARRGAEGKRPLPSR